MKDPYFIAELTRQHLFSGSLKEEVMNPTTTEATATLKFLCMAIEKPLNSGDSEPFYKLLQVMEKFDNSTLNKLAKQIEQNLNMNGTTKDSELLQKNPPGIINYHTMESFNGENID